MKHKIINTKVPSKLTVTPLELPFALLEVSINI